MAILKIKDENGTYITIPAITGANGQTGAVGPMGPAGPAGKDGTNIEVSNTQPVDENVKVWINPSATSEVEDLLNTINILQGRIEALESKEKTIIYSGALLGESSVTLANVKRYLDVYVKIQFGDLTEPAITMKYTIDTQGHSTTRPQPTKNYGGGVVTPFDETTINSQYMSESCYDSSTGLFTHVRIGYRGYSDASFTFRAANESYAIYQIETYN